MWRKATLSIPGNMAAVNCAMLPVHPWVYGVGRSEESGSYLSPQNAVDYLAGKLAGSGGPQRVVVFMVCATDHPDFMQALTQFSAVLPLPVFSQVARMANTAATLATTKMQLPANAGNGLPLPQPLSTATNRMAMNAQRIAQAKDAAGAGANLAGLTSALSGFANAKAAALASVESALNGLLAGSAQAWVFTASGSAATLASEMRKNVPQQDAVFTLATLFAGEDLTTLEAMINDTDSHAGTGR
ncbi:hypothetical protein ACS78I_07170 [Yersinia enterocolitica]|uniref:hypothetical protein n=1 Tax=Yersinia enterocolitica TaxID=630 RepID=UPI0028B3E198|nr:hypothetical protein [Yersinia enterocolitica]EKN6173953.1 hypothetical protein [Yersinia enterocolitica]EKN6390903.1 hypothetical protein [Yersinia enterocolitica]ELI7905113.1 hypothetical protein [Yersinia enterocolitica]HDL6694212.1 hypothetical protein [Yersinia enterocolitica]